MKKQTANTSHEKCEAFVDSRGKKYTVTTKWSRELNASIRAIGDTLTPHLKKYWRTRTLYQLNSPSYPERREQWQDDLANKLPEYHIQFLLPPASMLCAQIKFLDAIMDAYKKLALTMPYPIQIKY